MVGAPVWGAVIVAAGRSQRFGVSDKTMVELAGCSVLARSIAAMLADPRIAVVVVVASQANVDECRRLAARAFVDSEIISCLGGATRSGSVRAGLAALPERVDHVAIHDAARPLVPKTVVRAVLDAAERAGASVPVVKVASTLLVQGEDERVAGKLARERVREAQTPQAARRALLNAALRAYPDETDESSALFRYGAPVATVAGHRQNIKLTTMDDLLIAGALLAILEDCC